MRGTGVGSSGEETNLRRSIVMHNLHTRVCTHKVRLWWFDTQLSFNRGLIFDWCIGENVGWRELSKILKQKTKLDDSHKIHYWLTKGLGSLIWGHQTVNLPIGATKGQSSWWVMSWNSPWNDPCWDNPWQKKKSKSKHYFCNTAISLCEIGFSSFF